MSDIPNEILEKILSRLPVAPLLRFRCVSKSWKCLIEDQQFINHHLNHSRKTNSNLHIIIDSRHHRRLYSADFDLLNETNMDAFKELSHPFIEAEASIPVILGSCDGLLVLRNDEDDVTILWNPSVRRFHEIPIELPRDDRDRYSFYGFGYDVVSDDYKLIRIVRICEKDDNGFDFEVKVFSLKSNSWREIPDFPYYLDWILAHGVLASGALHWIVNLDTSVAAFDLGTEEFRLVPLPKFSDDRRITNLVVLGGCLCLILLHVNKDHVEIWIMKEYGVEESWSILAAFDLCDFRFTRQLTYSKCGRKVLLGLNDRVLVWYDLDKRSTVVPMVQMPLDNISNMCTCLQSLVLLNKGACDFDLVTKKKQEREEKKRSCKTRND